LVVSNIFLIFVRNKTLIMSILTKTELDKLTFKEFKTHLIESIKYDNDDYHDELLIYREIRFKESRLEFYKSFILNKTFYELVDDTDINMIEENVKRFRPSLVLSNLIKAIGVEGVYEIMLNDSKNKAKNVYKLY
jgi:hypothetical protein